MYALGETETPDFPVSSGAYNSPNAKPKDLFLSKYDSTGKVIIYSARIGGSQLEKGNALAVDTLGQVYITGSTTSIDFPTTNNSFQSQKTLADDDVFFVKLNASGTALLYSTFLIGMTTDIAHG
ncbi:MAG: SBBP repeat-containing protein, partial [bacterium]